MTVATLANLADITLPPDWTDAACRGVDPEVWYPNGKQPTAAMYRRARDICDTCPIRKVCLEYAMEREGGRKTSSRWGMWGGMDPHERALLARRRRRR